MPQVLSSQEKAKEEERQSQGLSASEPSDSLGFLVCFHSTNACSTFALSLEKATLVPVTFFGRFLKFLSLPISFTHTWCKSPLSYDYGILALNLGVRGW